MLALITALSIACTQDGEDLEKKLKEMERAAGGMQQRVMQFGGQDDPERELKRLSRRLDLTEEQEGKVKEILKKEADAKKDTRDRIREVLTDEQKQKYDQAQQGGGARVMQFGGGAGGDWGSAFSTGKGIQKELNLTDDQVKKIDEVAKEFYSDTSRWQGRDWSKWQEGAEADHKELGEKIKPVLTDEQKPKFDEIWPSKSMARQWGGGTRRGDTVPAETSKIDRVKAAMESLKIEKPDDASAIRELVQKVVDLQKDLTTQNDKVTKRARELTKDETATDEAIGKEIETLREERRAVEKNVAGAQKALREVVTYKQELVLIEQGLLR